MFRNVGEKIKFWAKVSFWLGVAIFTLGGLGYIAEGVTNNNGVAVISGIIIPIVGSGFSWVGSLFIYGFGKLIVNTDILVSMQYRNNEDDE